MKRDWQAAYEAGAAVDQQQGMFHVKLLAAVKDNLARAEGGFASVVDGGTDLCVVPALKPGVVPQRGELVVPFQIQTLAQDDIKLVAVHA